MPCGIASSPERGSFLREKEKFIFFARKQAFDVYSEHRRGKQTDGTKFRKSSADAVGNIKGFESFRFCDFDKVARVFGRGCDDIVFVVFAEFFFQNVGDDKVLTHRFGGRARFRDDVEHCFCGVNNIEQRVHTFGIDVVNHYDDVFAEFDRVIGLEQIAVFHVNDSLNPLGAHKDRHANIGQGTIGYDTLHRLVHDETFANVPKILETPWLCEEGSAKKTIPPYKDEIEWLLK